MERTLHITVKRRDPNRSLMLCQTQGPDSIKRYHLTSIGNPIVEIRRSYDRLISTTGFPIPVRQHLYIESGTRCRRQGQLHPTETVGSTVRPKKYAHGFVVLAARLGLSGHDAGCSVSVQMQWVFSRHAADLRTISNRVARQSKTPNWTSYLTGELWCISKTS